MVEERNPLGAQPLQTGIFDPRFWNQKVYVRMWHLVAMMITYCASIIFLFMDGAI